MDLVKSQKIVKVLGIIDIIVAVLCLIAALGMLGIGGLGAVSGAEPSDELATGIAAFLLGGIVMLVSGIVGLVEGIFSLRAAKDASKAKPLWVISLIALVLSALSLITSFKEGGQEIFSAVISLLVDGGIFYLANNIKKQA